MSCQNVDPNTMSEVSDIINDRPGSSFSDGQNLISSFPFYKVSVVNFMNGTV